MSIKYNPEPLIANSFEDLVELSYNFEKFLEDVKRGGNRTFNALFEM